jgi:pSer/pThr/pTyr-binding forkhead associated (FHA) protein
VPLSGLQLTIGRDSGNDVRLRDDPTVSRRHAVLQRLAAGWAIHDHSSLNGTFVNDELLTGGRPLYPGDEIRLGDTILIYHREHRR